MRKQRVLKGKLGGNPDLIRLQKQKHLEDVRRIKVKVAEDNPLVYHMDNDINGTDLNDTNQYLEEANDIFDFWSMEMDKLGVGFSGRRRAKVLSRLKEGYTVEQIKRAIVGCKTSPWHQGENDRGEKFDDLTLICANSSKARTIH